jgi:hypothetical protein
MKDCQRLHSVGPKRELRYAREDLIDAKFEIERLRKTLEWLVSGISPQTWPFYLQKAPTELYGPLCDARRATFPLPTGPNHDR